MTLVNHHQAALQVGTNGAKIRTHVSLSCMSDGTNAAIGVSS
jgi:hypothetical protein